MAETLSLSLYASMVHALWFYKSHGIIAGKNSARNGKKNCEKITFSRKPDSATGNGTKRMVIFVQRNNCSVSQDNRNWTHEQMATKEPKMHCSHSKWEKQQKGAFRIFSIFLWLSSCAVPGMQTVILYFRSLSVRNHLNKWKIHKCTECRLEKSYTIFQRAKDAFV